MVLSFLLTHSHGAGDLLPVTTEPGPTGQHFLIAGDLRINEHGILGSMHTIWMREHNRLCDSLSENAEFMDLSSDEQFQKARQVCSMGENVQTDAIVLRHCISSQQAKHKRVLVHKLLHCAQ